ncbi:hypothetical protein, partial [Mesorhizobium sp. M1365]|uniref:hypothetical protein n=1 Tax=Mesorhizobium sp. M1365 TaxID=2957090 RepID=UPI00333BA77E
MSSFRGYETLAWYDGTGRTGRGPRRIGRPTRRRGEKHHEGNVRPGNDFDLLAALGADLPGAVRASP